MEISVTKPKQNNTINDKRKVRSAFSGVSLPPEIYCVINNLAQQKRRSISSIICELCEEALLSRELITK